MRKFSVMLVVCGCIIARGSDAHGSQALVLEVSPAVMQAPGYVVVRALIEPSDDNRWLDIVAESPDFSRRSVIELEGRSTPRLAVFEYPNLPPGVYEVRGLLIGTRGQRAGGSRFVKIIPTAGSSRR
jgi:hypothetical protein